MTDKEEAQEHLGLSIDRLENIAYALKLPMSADFHLEHIKVIIPEIVVDLKKQFSDAFGQNPWDDNSDVTGE